MPWLGHAPDAPDSHRMWAEPGSAYEAALRASGWRHEVPAPGTVLPTEDDVEDDEQPPPAEPPMPPSVVLKRKRDRNA